MFVKLSNSIYKRHILIWLLLILYIIYTDVTKGLFIAKFFYLFFFVLNFIYTYYLLLFKILPKLYLKQLWLLVFGICLSVIFFIFYDFIHLKYVLPYFGGNVERGDLKGIEFIKSSLLLYVFVFLSSLGSYLNYISIKRYKLVLEKENNILTSELNFLKHQFNSHLTFNFLNFCYAKFLKISTKGSESVEYFSEMLRYSLSSRSDKKKTLNEEVEYIQNFINIQKCLSEIVNVNLNYYTDNENYIIMPMILNVFIENAFKHGVINDQNNPIEIKINAENGILKFELKNRISLNEHLSKTGIGIENIKKTLELFYPKQYKLEINNIHSKYLVKLEIVI